MMNNVDSSEINKFSELAARWWDKAGECQPLHEINPLRMSFIERHFALSGKKLLDVGCGGGILSESLASAGAQVTAIDLAESSLQVAKLHLLESNLSVDYQLISVETLAQQRPGQFDGVVCMEMLEHVPDPQSIITACAQLLQPGGHLWVSTINRNVSAFFKAIVGAEYILELLPRGTHHYEKFIKPSELIGWARAVNLTCTDRIGIDYKPLQRQYVLTPKVEVNYILHFIKQ